MDTQTQTHNSQPGKSGDFIVTDGLLRAYGLKVKELLSQSDAATWVDELWDMYTGFTLFSQEAGYDPKVHDKFVSFKELVFFFQDVGKMKP